MIANPVSFESVARLVCSRVGWTYDDLTTVGWKQVRTEISAALNWIWNTYWFEDLMVTERVTLRPVWQPLAIYTPGDEVYHSESDAYYTATRGGSGVVPATLGTDGVWMVVESYWAKQRATNYSEADWAARAELWELDVVYAAGDRVLWNGEEYGCISSHQSNVGLMPDSLPNWSLIPAWRDVIPWFSADRATIGRMRSVSVWNPDRCQEPLRFEFAPQSDGILIQNLTVTRPWVSYRVRCPELNGDVWSTAAGYAAEPDRKAVWGNTPTAAQALSLVVDGVTTRIFSGTLQIKSLDDGLWYSVVARDAGGVTVYSLESPGMP